MRTISAADANRHFSKLLRDVRDGETVTITSRGTPVARLVPIDDQAAANAVRAEVKRRLFERLEKQPALNLGPFRREDAYDDDAP